MRGRLGGGAVQTRCFTFQGGGAMRIQALCVEPQPQCRTMSNLTGLPHPPFPSVLSCQSTVAGTAIASMTAAMAVSFPSMMEILTELNLNLHCQKETSAESRPQEMEDSRRVGIGSTVRLCSSLKGV